MAALWMCELAPTEIAGSDALNRKQLAGQKVSTHDRTINAESVNTPPRVLRVLVVDDDEDAADGFVRLVRHWRHATSFAYGGLAGLTIAAAQHPDVVLLDVLMPLMDGCEFARQLRRNLVKTDCLIIAITGNPSEECRRKCTAAGIDMVLIKPVQPEVVETLLMLESARVNQFQAAPAVGVASPVR